MGYFDLHFLAAEAIHLVMRPDGDARDRCRYLEVSAAGEGLFVHMRMQEDAPAEHGAVGPDHFPCIGIVVPTGVGMGDGDAEAEYSIAGRCQPDDLDADNIRLARRAGP
ncbi:MAG: hypothetical protein ACMVY4_13690 [Minwuia sp.]|uniref:hypothetical protein n=1 Tax=Minwuia sp. TaxID=2493630 RepID=UPI003A84F83F